MTETSLLTKYRPAKWSEVIGQAAVVRSLKVAIEKGSSHAFLLVGPSGTGKTTLARLAATALGCKPIDRTEVDAATHTGIEDMREVASGLVYRPLGEGAIKVVICDECFVKGTRVLTPEGLKPIEILQPGHKVIGAFGVQTIKAVQKKRVDLTRLLNVWVGSAKFTCSREHLFLTNYGWVKAEDANGAIAYQEVSPYLRDLWDSILEQRLSNQALFRLFKKELLNLWKRILCKLESWRAFDLLGTGLYFGFTSESSFKELGNSLTLSYPSSGGGASGRNAKSLENEALCLGSISETKFCKDDYKQPYELAWNKREDALNQRQEWNLEGLESSKRGEWARSNKASIIITLIGRWLFGVGNNYRAFAWGRWLAFQLQGRYWISRYKVRGGGRWIDSSWRSKVNRSEERRPFNRIRVESLTAEEQRGVSKSAGGGGNGIECYDLEIIEHPSYLIEGKIIVHNCHMLSKAAWNSLLKILEEPPAYVYWFLCTTETGKVPETVKTRCLKYELKPVPSSEIYDFLQQIVVGDNLEVTDDIVNLCAKEAGGSPRQALANLGVCLPVKTKEEAAELLQSAAESGAAIELARALYRGATWKELQAILAGLKDVNAESIRQIVRAYGTSIILGNGGGASSKAGPVIEVLDLFTEPFHSGDGLTPVIMACAKLTLS